MNHKSFDFFFELYERKNIPAPYLKVKNTTDNSVLENNSDSINIDNYVYNNFFIPDYFLTVFDNTKFRLLKVNQFFKGYAIFLHGMESADEYIKKRFKKNAKSIRRRIKRLEGCFDINYTMYYGEIEQERYDELIEHARKMLIRRFEQRNDVSVSLMQWDKVKKIFFDMINSKKASLFLITQNNIPIVVSLNYHYKQVMFSSISAYDIDFEKFSLGSVEIFNKLNWCINNQHTIYEMGMGDLDYKNQWCNHLYHFRQEIIYPQKSFNALLNANILHLKSSLKEMVYKTFYVKWKRFKNKRKKPFVSIHEIVKEDVIDLNSFGSLHEINLNTDEYRILKKPLYDFLYQRKEHINKVKVKKIEELENSFVIIGSTETQKIKVINNRRS